MYLLGISSVLKENNIITFKKKNKNKCILDLKYLLLLHN